MTHSNTVWFFLPHVSVGPLEFDTDLEGMGLEALGLEADPSTVEPGAVTLRSKVYPVEVRIIAEAIFSVTVRGDIVAYKGTRLVGQPLADVLEVLSPAEALELQRFEALDYSIIKDPALDLTLFVSGGVVSEATFYAPWDDQRPAEELPEPVEATGDVAPLPVPELFEIVPDVRVGNIALTAPVEAYRFPFGLRKASAKQEHDGLWEEYVSRSHPISITTVDGLILSVTVSGDIALYRGMRVVGIGVQELTANLEGPLERESFEFIDLEHIGDPNGVVFYARAGEVYEVLITAHW